MALSAVLFSTMNLLARMATTSAPWPLVASVRALLGALVAFAVARARKTSLMPRAKGAVFWRSLVGTASMMATFFALSSRSVSLGDTVTLLNLAPIFLAIFAPLFLRERTSRTLLSSLVLALAGVVLVVQPGALFGSRSLSAPFVASGPSPLATYAAAACAALTTSIAMMLLRHAGKTESSEAIAFHFSLFAALVTGAFSLFDLRIPTVRDLLLMGAAGILAGLAQLAMTRAYALEQAARVGGSATFPWLRVPFSGRLSSVIAPARSLFSVWAWSSRAAYS